MKFRFDTNKLIQGFPGKNAVPRELVGLQEAAIQQLMAFIEADDRWQTITQIAYFLATVYHECAYLVRMNNGKKALYRSMAPVKEAGSDDYFNGRYGPQTDVGRRLGNTQPGDGARFPGHGYVQDTGRKNHGAAGARLTGTRVTLADLAGMVGGAKLEAEADFRRACGTRIPEQSALVIAPGTFTAYPSLLLVPKLSYASAVDGMFTGRFTGKKLTEYVNEHETDYIDARRVINGTDRQIEIAECAKTFEGLLRVTQLTDAAAVVTDDHPSVTDLVPQQPSTATVAAAATAVGAAVAVENTQAAAAVAPVPAAAANMTGGETVKVLNWKDKLHEIGGWISGKGTLIYGIYERNPVAVIAGLVIILGLLGAAAYLNRERLRAWADPTKLNVK